ncbi:VWA domain-containing protein [Persicobacter psychrovividus]|uniref:Membrane protein n=1 Tax=Persicobacter psychrovividus TaxID=387638 RepID=A0ABN6LLE8_9BACT|nr:membrane protein [Persicobacter psychrovividus]
MEQWLNIDWDHFHFIRVEWLWLLVPFFGVFIFSFFGFKTKHSWKKAIAKHLRPYVIQKGNKYSFLAPLSLFFGFGLLSIIAIAGPAWEKEEIPGAKSEAILLIGMDVSLSMMVEDVSPNRLERAKLKIKDLLDANPRARVGLFAYSGLAFPVIAPCKDYQLIKHQLAALNPGVMPVQGTELENALLLSSRIFSRSEAPSTLLLVTDNIEKQQANQLLQYVDSTNHKIELMTLASLQGGRVPKSKNRYFTENGAYVISKLNSEELFRLQQHNRINVTPITLDNTDVNDLAEEIRNHLIFIADSELSEEQWQDNGYLLVWVVALMFVFWFRKGWMIQWCAFFVLFSSCDHKDLSWDDLWYTADYQAQKLMDSRDYEAAAEQFISQPHKGVAYYKAGDYGAAIEVFRQDSSAQSLYNLALAYAADSQFEKAQEAFLLSASMDPDNVAIQESLQATENILQQIDSLRKQQPQQAISLQEPEKKEPLKERKAQSEDEELSSDTEVDELPQDGNRVTDIVETGIRKAEEMDQPSDAPLPQMGASQDILLREISADPAEFLKRRFKYQQQKYYPSFPKPKQSW